jgi:hypothetical protein
VQDTSRASLGELAGLAIEQALVTYCCISKENVRCAIGGLEIRLSPQDGRELLRLLLQGTTSQEAEEAQPVPEQGLSQEQPVKQQEPTQEKSAQEDRPSNAGERPRMIIRGAESRISDTETTDAYQKRELFRAPSALSSQETARSSTPAPMGGDGGQYRDDVVSEEYLDSVLSFALTMGIIEGYTKDREARTITLRTGATTTSLSFWETLEYLTNSMLYELRPKSER